MSTQSIDGFVTQNLWKPKLIKLTGAYWKGGVGGTSVYVDPFSITHIKMITKDPEGVLEKECTYVYLGNTGVYVLETPDEVAALREKALDGK